MSIVKYYETYINGSPSWHSLSFYVIEDGGKTYHVQTEYRGALA